MDFLKSLNCQGDPYANFIDQPLLQTNLHHKNLLALEECLYDLIIKHLCSVANKYSLSWVPPTYVLTEPSLNLKSTIADFKKNLDEKKSTQLTIIKPRKIKKKYAIIHEMSEMACPQDLLALENQFNAEVTKYNNCRIQQNGLQLNQVKTDWSLQSLVATYKANDKEGENLISEAKKKLYDLRFQPLRFKMLDQELNLAINKLRSLIQKKESDVLDISLRYKLIAPSSTNCKELKSLQQNASKNLALTLHQFLTDFKEIKPLNKHDQNTQLMSSN